MRYLIIILFFSTINTVYAQQQKLSFELSAGFGSGWWIQESDYTIQNRLVTDWANSRLSLEIPLSASLKYKFGKHIHIGTGYTFRVLMAKKLYASSPITSTSTRTNIAENTVKIKQFYFSIESPLVKAKNFNLSPKIKLGSFQLESLHPDDGNFSDRLMFETALQFEFNSKAATKPFVEMYYSNLSFRSDTPLADKRVHHIQSIGTKFGIHF